MEYAQATAMAHAEKMNIDGSIFIWENKKQLTWRVLVVLHPWTSSRMTRRSGSWLVALGLCLRSLWCVDIACYGFYGDQRSTVQVQVYPICTRTVREAIVNAESSSLQFELLY